MNTFSDTPQPEMVALTVADTEDTDETEAPTRERITALVNAASPAMQAGLLNALSAMAQAYREGRSDDEAWRASCAAFNATPEIIAAGLQVSEQEQQEIQARAIARGARGGKPNA